MSAVAIPYDSSFAMGHRSSFAWPGSLSSSASSSSMMSGSDYASMTTGSEPSLTPPGGPKAMLASPSRSILSVDHHELKRQRDRARRDSKLNNRMRRPSVNSYTGSPPMSMPDCTSAMSLPVYTTAPAGVSLLSEPATTMGSDPYIHAYSSPMHDHSHGGSVYGTSYQHTMQPNYTMSMDYPTTYAATSDYSTRASSISVGHDSGMVYQMPSLMNPIGSGPSNVHENSHVRVVQSRPKPRCWEHGCNGRQFSTFSNLLRHQREKSGQATKATCPNCGAEFTRTTARNGHLLHDKCKQRRSS